MSKKQQDVVPDGSEIVVYRLVGKSPLLCHNAAAMARGSDEIKKRSVPKPEDEAKGGLYLDDKGRYVFPMMGVRNSIIRAAQVQRMKLGKLAASTVLSAALVPVEEFALLVDPKTSQPLTSYVVDTRRAVVQQQGIQRSRPRFNAWALDAAFELDTSMGLGNLAEGVLGVLGMAGKFIGIGDFRPDRKGLFGKFSASIVK